MVSVEASAAVRAAPADGAAAASRVSRKGGRLAAEADARRQRDGERGGEQRGAEVADHDLGPHCL